MLQEIADLRSKAFKRYVSNVDSIDTQGSLIYVVQPGNQPGDRTLAAAADADQGDLFTCFQLEIEPIEHRWPPVIGKGHSCHFNVPSNWGRQRHRIRFLRDARSHFEDFQDSSETGAETVEPEIHIHSHLQRIEQSGKVTGKSDESADCQSSYEHPITAIAEHGDR